MVCLNSEAQLQVRHAVAQILAPVRTGCVALGESLNQPGPQFPALGRGRDDSHLPERVLWNEAGWPRPAPSCAQGQGAVFAQAEHRATRW